MKSMVEPGKLYVVRARDNSKGAAILYEDLSEVLQAKVVENHWIPSYTTNPSNMPSELPRNRCIPTSEPFVVLEKETDSFGGLYYRCLYANRIGWLVGSRRLSISEAVQQ